MASVLSVLSDSFSLSAHQHSEISSLSPSVSGSDTGSEHTRSSSSASHRSRQYNEFDVPISRICVQLERTALTPKLLQYLYHTHAQDGILTLRLGGYMSPEDPSWSTGCVDGTMYRYSEDYRAVSSQFEAARNDADVLLAISIALLRPIISYSSSDGSSVYIIECPAVAFPPLSYTPSFDPTVVAALPKDTICNIPTLEEWHRLWAIWDLVTLQMIPQRMLHQKPIDLRHKCLFYIGHIPTFLDMLLSKAIGGQPTEPRYFWNIFERGIDPHVDDPDHCHNHSEVPECDEDWPTLTRVLEFRNGVRARLGCLYDDLTSGRREVTRNIARTLVMTYEHEGFHVETLLYMLIQRGGSGTLPPPGFTIPPWSALAQQFDQTPQPSTPHVTIGPAELILGHDDSEGDDPNSKVVHDHEYGWDNESPPRTVHVNAFRAEWRPVTNGEFEAFWRKGGIPLPKSWVEEAGEIKVRTLYGPVPISVAQHWPVLTSYDDLAVYARSKGGRLPTEPELRLFLDMYDVGFEGGANTGFRNWHPVPATAGLEANSGKGSNGGVWEWTSTLFEIHNGLVPTKLFTGYSTDFFDAKHQVVLGASYATIPRLGRRTVRNFYQHNYPYPWVSARVVYDL
ncbi:hypothetical protein E1B28_010044 [Marasmius oreades]|uniref:Uncharacterized protein n=1 Tax=Marasmius oreades TaxID=181124 RepID=A0A9P7UQQ7_9AGAR|nr:uncharacterized protein E1B28_010044 [Marasmius oreades]KAG7090977.1 hypothetical protein E1B28_010044 [Marasmius oreades]